MNCSFCGKDIPRGTEMIFVNKRGKAQYYCSSKCDKNMNKLGRKPRETKWTVAYKEEKDIRTKGMPAPVAKEEAPKVKPVEEAAPVEEKKAPVKKAKESNEVKKTAPKKKK
ncbi:MAG: 50S ribosomal protein L24e [Candidatus Altiarchaeia archaeon]